MGVTFGLLRTDSEHGVYDVVSQSWESGSKEHLGNDSPWLVTLPPASAVHDTHWIQTNGHHVNDSWMGWDNPPLPHVLTRMG